MSKARLVMEIVTLLQGTPVDDFARQNLFADGNRVVVKCARTARVEAPDGQACKRAIATALRRYACRRLRAAEPVRRRQSRGRQMRAYCPRRSARRPSLQAGHRHGFAALRLSTTSRGRTCSPTAIAWSSNARVLPASKRPTAKLASGPSPRLCGATPVDDFARQNLFADGNRVVVKCARTARVEAPDGQACKRAIATALRRYSYRFTMAQLLVLSDLSAPALEQLERKAVPGVRERMCDPTSEEARQDAAAAMAVCERLSTDY